MSDAQLERARSEIVFALKKQFFGVPVRPIQVTPKEPPRLAVKVENQDLESAIDDMLDRFPQTLKYLAK